MKKIVILTLAVFGFSWISVVSAEQSPESIVTCAANAGPYLVLGQSIPGTINAEQCRTHSTVQPPDLCAPCISSLENQGCKIVDVVVNNGVEIIKATYLMSCVSRAKFQVGCLRDTAKMVILDMLARMSV